ncbi:hypothetical protein [Nocardioides sp.]|uniref:hypothetical protein n=1 Tax=Nocardioides sp. TaxID=35761 RepID=UPI0035290FE8
MSDDPARRPPAGRRRALAGPVHRAVRPRTRVSAAVTRRLFDAVARRFDLCVVTKDPADATPRPTIVLHRPQEFYARIGRDGLIGFGEGYLTGAWDSPTCRAC